jgi:uncharacterized protein YacL
MLGSVLPAEEFVFFVITNVLIVFGMTLALTTGRELYHRIAHLRPRRRSNAAEIHVQYTNAPTLGRAVARRLRDENETG